MAAPEQEVLSPPAVPGKVWSPALGELWGPFLSCRCSLPSFSPDPSSVRISWRPSALVTIAPTARDPMGSPPLRLHLGGVLVPS